MKQEAREAFLLKEGSGMTLPDCVRIALGRDIQASVKTSTVDAVDGFVQHCLNLEKQGRLRPRTVQWYRDSLEILLLSFPASDLDDLTRPILKKWIEGFPNATSAQTLYRAVRRMIRWSFSQNPPMINHNPTAGLVFDLGKRKKNEISILSPEQCQQLIEKGEEYRYAFAVALFAMIRPEEIAGRDKPFLDWSAVDRENRAIWISAEISKTGKARVIEHIPENFWEIIKDAPATGPICHSLIRQMIRKGREILDFKKWPQDVLRHSGASYYLAFTGDVGRLVLNLGHEGGTALIHTRYRRPLPKAQAEKFYQIGV
jgi:integrase